MNIKQIAINALTAIDVDELEKIDELSNKDGVHVYILTCGKNSHVLKFFSRTI